MSIDPTDTQAIDRAVAALRDDENVSLRSDGNYYCFHIAPITDEFTELPYSPSTNPAHAMELMKEMGESLKYLSLVRDTRRRKAFWVIAANIDELDWDDPFELGESARTPEIAICLAFIAWKESK